MLNVNIYQTNLIFFHHIYVLDDYFYNTSYDINISIYFLGYLIYTVMGDSCRVKCFE